MNENNISRTLRRYNKFSYAIRISKVNNKLLFSTLKMNKISCWMNITFSVVSFNEESPYEYIINVVFKSIKIFFPSKSTKYCNYLQ